MTGGLANGRRWADVQWDFFFFFFFWNVGTVGGGLPTSPKF
jgi:hypothetical protein